MELSDLEYPFPEPLSKLFTAIVECADDNQVLTLPYSVQNGVIGNTTDYIIGRGKRKRTVSGLKGDPLLSLQMLGFIERPYSDKKKIYLYPLAFERAKYDRKNPLEKWWIRVWLTRERTALIVVGFATFILVILQISQLIHTVWLWLNT